MHLFRPYLGILFLNFLVAKQQLRFPSTYSSLPLCSLYLPLHRPQPYLFSQSSAFILSLSLSSDPIIKSSLSIFSAFSIRVFLPSTWKTPRNPAAGKNPSKKTPFPLRSPKPIPDPILPLAFRHELRSLA